MSFPSSHWSITTGENLTYAGICFSENGLFVLLETREHEDTPPPVSAKTILDFVLTLYTNYEKHSLSSVAQILTQLEQKKEFISSLVIGICNEKTLYLGCMGDGEVVMVRKGKMGILVQNGDVSSGEVNPGDSIFFVPSSLHILFSDELFLQYAISFDPLAFKQRIMADLGNFPQVIGITLLGIKIDGENVESKTIKSSPLLTFKNKIIDLKNTRLKFLTKFLPKKIYDEDIDPKDKKSKKILLLVSLVLVGILVVSIFFNMNRTRDLSKKKKLTETVSLVSHQYEEAMSLIDLNPIRARALFSDAKISLTPLIPQFAKNSQEYKEIQEWLSKIGEQEVLAYKIYKLTAAPLFFDVTFLKTSAQISKMVSYQNTKAILDIPNRVVYKLSTDTKQSEIVAGSDIVKDATSLSIHGSTVYVVNEDGIVSIETKNKSSKTVIAKDESWGEIVSMASFGGNIYLLDKGKNAIWKYTATDFGYSKIANYLNSGVSVNFSGAKQIVIDGSIWVLFTDGLSKFSKGLNDTFVISGFSETFSNLSSSSTSETDKYLYVLDQNLSRIVVFDKDGVYQSQYQWDELKNATDIVASEEEKKIFVGVGSKIYAIDIK